MKYLQRLHMSHYHYFHFKPQKVVYEFFGLISVANFVWQSLCLSFWCLSWNGFQEIRVAKMQKNRSCYNLLCKYQIHGACSIAFRLCYYKYSIITVFIWSKICYQLFHALDLEKYKIVQVAIFLWEIIDANKFQSN